MYYVVKGLESTVVSTSLNGYKHSDVVFFSWSKIDHDDLSLAACEAVAGFMNAQSNGGSLDYEWGRYRLNDGLYPKGGNPPRGICYVYQYFDADNTYYVGKGILKRWRDHFDGIDAEELDIKETAKKERIRLAKTKNPAYLPQDLCHVIAEFTDDLRNTRAFALENFIISGYYGVIDLTNLTGGNNSVERKSVRWRAMPKHFLADSRPSDNTEWWSRYVSTAEEWLPGTQGQMQTNEAHFFKRQLPSNYVRDFVDTLSQHLDHLRDRLEWIENGEFVIAGEVTIEANLISSPVRFQFKFSEMSLACCINVRPQRVAGRMDIGGFKAFIESKYDHPPKIRNCNSQPFLKPYSCNQNGRHDVYFSASPNRLLTTTPVSRNCLEYGLDDCGESEFLSLVSAIKKLMNRYLS